MKFGLVVAFLIVGIIFFAVGTHLSIYRYINIEKQKYRFQNHFPYELYSRLSFKDNLIGNLFTFIGYLFLILYFIFFAPIHSEGFLIFVLVSGVVSSLTIALMNVTSVRALKEHLALFTLSIGFLFALNGAICYYSFHHFIYLKENLFLGSAIISSIYIVLLVISLFSKNMTFEIKMEQIKDANGAITFARPKNIFMCIYEWFLAVSPFIVGIALLFISIVLYLK